MKTNCCLTCELGERCECLNHGGMCKNPAAVALGKLGGSKTSEKKKKAVAQNLEKAREAKKKQPQEN